MKFDNKRKNQTPTIPADAADILFWTWTDANNVIRLDVGGVWFSLLYIFRVLCPSTLKLSNGDSSMTSPVVGHILVTAMLP
jgi:hypothetical protein